MLYGNRARQRERVWYEANETSKLLSGGSLHEVCHLDPESAAWEFIRKLSPDTILSATPPRVV